MSQNIKPTPVSIQLTVNTNSSLCKSDFEEEVDVNLGSWMSEFETMGVLLSQLPPLMTSNPYVYVSSLFNFAKKLIYIFFKL